MDQYVPTYVLGYLNGVIASHLESEGIERVDEVLNKYIKPTPERSLLITLLNNGILQRDHVEGMFVIKETLDNDEIPLVEKARDLLEIYVLPEYPNLSDAARGIFTNLLAMALARGLINGGEFMAELIADDADIGYIESMFDDVITTETEEDVLYARSPELLDVFNRINQHMKGLQKDKPFPTVLKRDRES